MKTVLHSVKYLLVLLIAASLSSCNDDNGLVIIDYGPIILQLNVIDAQGNDLLDTETEGNILDSGITATYNGKEYPLLDLSNSGRSREYLAQFIGLYLDPELPLEEATPELLTKLCFGEFQGHENYDKTVVFHFPSAARDVSLRVVSVVSKNSWSVDYYLNGKLLDGDGPAMPVTIVLE